MTTFLNSIWSYAADSFQWFTTEGHSSPQTGERTMRWKNTFQLKWSVKHTVCAVWRRCRQTSQFKVTELTQVVSSTRNESLSSSLSWILILLLLCKHDWTYSKQENVKQRPRSHFLTFPGRDLPAPASDLWPLWVGIFWTTAFLLHPQSTCHDYCEANSNLCTLSLTLTRTLPADSAKKSQEWFCAILLTIAPDLRQTVNKNTCFYREIDSLLVLAAAHIEHTLPST